MFNAQHILYSVDPREPMIDVQRYSIISGVSLCCYLLGVLNTKKCKAVQHHFRRFIVLPSIGCIEYQKV